MFAKYEEGSSTEGLARLVMGIAIPRDFGGPASGVAAVKKGRMARTKEGERYMLGWKRSSMLQKERKRTESLWTMGSALETFITVGRPLGPPKAPPTWQILDRIKISAKFR
jgi:hypothetical protein